MKIGFRNGHTINTQGVKTAAVGILNEYDVIRDYSPYAKAYLEKYKGIEIIDVTPPIKTFDSSRSEVFYGIDKANEKECDLFISCHANRVDDTRAHGSGVFHHENSDNGKKLADCIQKEIVSLGFHDRGDKTAAYWELVHTKMVAVVVEPFFLENQEDCDLYDPKTLGEAIGRGIINYIGYTELREDVELKELRIENLKLKDELGTIKTILKSIVER